MSGAEPPSPLVTVVVPVRDDPRLPDCLAALAQQDYPTSAVELIVVDNGSSDDVASVVRGALDGTDLDAKVLAEPRGGSYTARNAALSVARGEIIAFTDSDCRPDPTWLSAAVRAVGSRVEVAAGRVRVSARNARKPHPIEAYELVHAFPQQTYVARGGGSVTANLIARRNVFEVVGPFLDQLMSGADIEWGQRATRMGYPTQYVDEAVVEHPARHTYAAIRHKLTRVMSGRAERDRLEGRGGPREWPSARAWIPPIGAFGRAWHSEALITTRAKGALVVGEFYHRYAAAVIATRLAAASRRNLRRER